MMFPLVRDLAADGVPVTVTCRVLGFSTQSFYQWRARPCSDRDRQEAVLVNAAIDVHADDPVFGYRFITDELVAAGHVVSERRVWRLCSQHRLWSVISRRRGSAKRPGPAVHDDLVQRQFTADGRDLLWYSDITEHWTSEGKLYLCAIKDAWSNRIVGYSIDSRMKSRLAVNALRMAVVRRSPAGTTVHTDRGSQFRSRGFVAELARNGLRGSMGRVGAAGDNAAMESFFSLLQHNVLNTRSWDTRLQLRLAIVTWIERTYHRRRRQRGLGRLTPIEFETVHQGSAATLAA